MAGRAHATVGDTAGLAALRSTYLAAVDAGDDELVVDLAPGCLGLDPPGSLASLELAPVNATAPPPLAVTLRSEGLCVLAGIPIRIAAQRVTLEGIAVVGAVGAAIAVSAAERVELRRVVALGNIESGFGRAGVDLSATGTTGTTVQIEQTVIARNTARDAALGLYCAARAWFDEAHLDGVTVTGGEADALVAIDSLRLLRATGCSLLAGAARTLLRLSWPIPDGELAACRLSPGAGELVAVSGTAPGEAPKLRLAGGTAVTSSIAGLPPSIEADGTVTEVAPETLDAEIEATVAAARDRVLAVDSRLARLLG